jgi:hypothetical protein
MKRINPKTITETKLNRLEREAEQVNFDNTRRLTAADRRALKKAAGKGGRPRVGAGAKRINITVERTLLKTIDAYARRHGMTRAAVVAEGLRKLIAA